MSFNLKVIVESLAKSLTMYVSSKAVCRTNYWDQDLSNNRIIILRWRSWLLTSVENIGMLHIIKKWFITSYNKHVWKVQKTFLGYKKYWFKSKFKIKNPVEAVEFFVKWSFNSPFSAPPYFKRAFSFLFFRTHFNEFHIFHIFSWIVYVEICTPAWRPKIKEIC